MYCGPNAIQPLLETHEALNILVPKSPRHQRQDKAAIQKNDRPPSACLEPTQSDDQRTQSWRYGNPNGKISRRINRSYPQATQPHFCQLNNNWELFGRVTQATSYRRIPSNVPITPRRAHLLPVRQRNIANLRTRLHKITHKHTQKSLRVDRTASSFRRENSSP